MKALRCYGRRDLRYVDVPEPSPGPGQLKVKVNLAGICGSDLKEYATGPHLIAADKLPQTIGHEFAGSVAALGKGVAGFRVGDRVSGVGSRFCGECFFCHRGQYNLCLNSSFAGMNVDGCMAEYYVAPAYSLYKLPGSVSDEAGALVEPLAVALHAVRQGNVRPGDSVAVVGDGTIGLAALLAARAAGASAVYVVAKHKRRGELASALGATAVVYLNDGDPAPLIGKLTGGLGADVAVECVGQPETPALALSLVRRGGSVVLVGVFEKPGPFDFSTVTFSEKTVVGSSIYVHEGRTAVAMLADGRLEPGRFITSIIPLQDAVKKGFEELLHNKEDNLKILLRIP